MIWKVMKWYFVLLCMLSIFLFSSDSGDESDSKSSHLIVSIAELLVGHQLSDEERQEKIDQYALVIRKGAHFTIFLLLGLSVISLMKEYTSITWKTMFFAFVFSFFYACSDEVHQLFVPGRSGNIIDVGIDSIGAYFGVLIYYFYYQLRRKYE